jgi:UDP-N-acetylglucosamine transferase subunit ALG13
MIVVPNETLLDNHQVELADALGELGHLFSATPKSVLFNEQYSASCFLQLL